MDGGGFLQCLGKHGAVPFVVPSPFSPQLRAWSRVTDSKGGRFCLVPVRSRSSNSFFRQIRRDFRCKKYRPGLVLCFKQEEEVKRPSSSLDFDYPNLLENESAEQAGKGELTQGGEEDESAEQAGKGELTQGGEEERNWLLTVRKAVYKLFRIHDESWVVPWTAETIIQVMLLWVASFWFIGTWVIPFVVYVAGFRKETLTYRGQALYSLLTDIVEGLAGIAILRRCLARFRPLPIGWFGFSLKGSWLLDVLMGCLLFPLVNRLSLINMNLVPSLPMGVSSVEQSIVARDPVAMACYVAVVSVCAPIWEEIVFRGFLLPSLTRYMPLWMAIFASAVAFALAHFNTQRLLPLVFLGIIMGTVFVKSRNLFASMILHSLWNGFVFLDLMR